MLLAELAHTPIPASVVLLLRALGLRINFSQRRSDRNVRDAFREVTVVKGGDGEIQRVSQVAPDVPLDQHRHLEDTLICCYYLGVMICEGICCSRRSREVT